MLTGPFRLALAVLLFSAPMAAPSRAAPPLPPSVTLPAELERVLRDYEAAWTARDPQALASLFTADGFVLSGGSPPVQGSAAIVERYTGSGGPLALRAFAYALAGDVAYILGGYAAAPGAADAGKFTLTLRRRADGHWLIVSDMDNGNG